MTRIELPQITTVIIGMKGVIQPIKDAIILEQHSDVSNVAIESGRLYFNNKFGKRVCAKGENATALVDGDMVRFAGTKMRMRQQR